VPSLLPLLRGWPASVLTVTEVWARTDTLNSSKTAARIELIVVFM